MTEFKGFKSLTQFDKFALKGEERAPLTPQRYDEWVKKVQAQRIKRNEEISAREEVRERDRLANEKANQTEALKNRKED